MCYSIIVVDDERIIREGIRAFIESKNCGFEVEAVFEDGESALDYLKNHHVDLILTDIRMSGMSGLDLAKYVKENIPGSEVVILSGYRDFEYAKRAITYGVTEYLLKPVKNDNILKTLEKVKMILKKREEAVEMYMRYDELLVYSREKFFLKLVFGNSYAEDELQHEYDAIRLGIDADKLYATILRIEWPEEFINNKWSYGRLGVQSAVKNFFAANPDNIFSMTLSENIFLVISKHDTENADEIKKQSKDIFGTDVQVHCEYACRGLDGLKQYRTMPIMEVKNNIEKERRILLCTYFNLEMYDEGKELFFDLIKNSDKPSEAAASLIRLMFENVLNDENAFDCGMYCLKLYDGRCTPSYVFDMFCKAIMERRMNEDVLIKKIKTYVRDNYSKDITLETIAVKIYLHPVYMSRTFKERVGENFSEYLLRYRMTKAIALLRSKKYKIYEVSKMVGYNNHKYFSKQFKKYTGYTPKSYCSEFFEDGI